MDMKPRTDLPMKLISTILSYLPAKTLLRFKSVSKTWYALIQSPQFISTHCTAHESTNLVIINTPSNSHRGLTDKFYRWNRSVSNDPLHNLIPEPPIFSSAGPRNCYLRFQGSCDGLVCCSSSGSNSCSLYVWNPSIRKFKLIKTESFLNGTRHAYGIGKRVSADSDDNDYRVVSFTYEKINKNGDSPSVASVDIYTLSTNSWKRTNAVIRGFIRDPCISTNGVLYWLCSKQKEEKIVIMSFNLQREVHREIILPIFASRVGRLMHIVKLKESLAFIAESDPTTLSVWVMKEKGYGVAVGQSWDKLFSVSVQRLDECRPVYFGSNGFLVNKCPDRLYNMRVYPDLLFFDFEKQHWINIGIDPSSLAERYCKTIDFTESLVLINENDDDSHDFAMSLYIACSLASWLYVEHQPYSRKQH